MTKTLNMPDDKYPIIGKLVEKAKKEERSLARMASIIFTDYFKKRGEK